MKHVSDAMALRKKLFDQLEKANLPCTSKEEASALLHVAIVGGGPTGDEPSYDVRVIKTKYLSSLQVLKLLPSYLTLRKKS
jgi:NADH dehydrogenase FAD-containing subunit